MDVKRKAPPVSGDNALVKRQRASGDNSKRGSADVSTERLATGAIIPSSARTSALKAPILQLEGHTGEVYAVKFDPTGQHIASGSFDRTALIWSTYGECENFLQLQGHKGAVLDLAWSRDSAELYTASADFTLGTWDLARGERVRKLVGHDDFVNSVAALRAGGDILLSASDDGTIGIWDPRQRAAIDYYEDKYPIMACCFSEAGNQVFSGGLDNIIKVWDVRQKAIVQQLSGHTDTITSLMLSPDGQHLLSNSMDSTVRTWNVAPFAPANRLVRTYHGAPHGFEKTLVRAVWSPDGSKIMAGSAERSVIIWKTETGKIEWALPGHHAVVNDVDFHPRESIIVSASTDRTLFLGELI